MKNPRCLKQGLSFPEAYELIDYLYGHLIDIKTMTDEYGANRIKGFFEGSHVVNYNSEYGCIMRSDDFIKEIRKA